MKVKVEFVVKTKYVGSEVKETVELEIDDLFSESEKNKEIQEYYEEWLCNNIDCGWKIID